MSLRRSLLRHTNVLASQRRALWSWLLSPAALALTLWGGLCLASAQPASTDADPILVTFHRANAQYREERYDEAAERYQSLLARGVENGVLYYNLGNARLKSGHTGEALWAYLRAQALMPRDADLRANLTHAQTLLPHAQGISITTPHLVRWLTWNGQCSTHELSLLVCILLWLVAGSWILSMWITPARPMLRPIASLMNLLASAVLIALITQTIWVDNIQKAIAIRQNVEVRFAPQDAGTVHFTLPEGAVVRVLNEEAGWVQIQRVDGRAGWVTRDTLMPFMRQPVREL